MRTKKERLLLITFILIFFVIIPGFFIYSSQQYFSYFITIDKLKSDQFNKTPIFHNVRLGGYVKKKSLEILDDGKVTFTLTDESKEEIKIIYNGLLPDLFRDNQGVVVLGKFKNNIFKASKILIKHDEYYYPKKQNVEYSKNQNTKKSKL